MDSADSGRGEALCTWFEKGNCQSGSQCQRPERAGRDWGVDLQKPGFHGESWCPELTTCLHPSLRTWGAAGLALWYWNPANTGSTSSETTPMPRLGPVVNGEEAKSEAGRVLLVTLEDQEMKRKRLLPSRVARGNCQRTRRFRAERVMRELSETGRARKRMLAWGPGEVGRGERGMPPESKKRKEPEPVEDLGLGGLYDFLPPPDPEKDKATATKARKAEQASTRPQLPPIDRSRVIFLDVDGVLLPAGSVEMIYIDGVMLPVRAAKEADFSRVALSNLRSIVQQTGATIVVSSEWRRREEMRDNIRRTLMTQDLPGFQDSTPIFQPSAELIKQRLDQAIIWAERRAREIGSWLKQHKEVKAWVAIDDIDFSWADSVKVPGTPLMKHRSVLTNPKHCITEKDADEAVRILLNPPVIAPGEEADAIAAARYLTEEALAKCNGGP
ncbi:Tristetraprolin [Durusdinium trenchii]|uniref:Tristetraprolin n=1 Tax=Durusdinium trenchii TaxID=1381693 RepID=A0ABP0RWQ4_9DINO